MLGKGKTSAVGSAWLAPAFSAWLAVTGSSGADPAPPRSEGAAFFSAAFFSSAAFFASAALVAAAPIVAGLAKTFFLDLQGSGVSRHPIPP
jgi:hypothetical protein